MSVLQFLVNKNIAFFLVLSHKRLTFKEHKFSALKLKHDILTTTKKYLSAEQNNFAKEEVVLMNFQPQL